MRVLIISDTHDNTSSIDDLFDKENTFDMLIHLGDVGYDADYIRENAGCPCYIVAGNNDFDPCLPKELIVEIEGKYALLTHGHRHGVSYGAGNLFSLAEINGVDIVMCGHSHVPEILEEDGIFVVNPGSLAYPRQSNRRKSYIVLEINNDKNFKFTIDYLD